MKNYLNIIYYIKTLYNEGTTWEFKRILGTGQHTSTPPIFYHKLLKRTLIFIPTFFLCYQLKAGFSKDFIADTIAALSIFIGLFTNVIFVIYNRFAVIPTDNASTSNTTKIENLKLKNFLKQFTFVTGKNLLIATLIILLLTIVMLFDDFFSINIVDFQPISFSHYFEKESIIVFLKFFSIVLLRFLILYLVIDFFLLLLYSLGALFTFLKREMN